MSWHLNQPCRKILRGRWTQQILYARVSLLDFDSFYVNIEKHCVQFPVREQNQRQLHVRLCSNSLKTKVIPTRQPLPHLSG